MSEPTRGDWQFDPGGHNEDLSVGQPPSRPLIYSDIGDDEGVIIAELLTCPGRVSPLSTHDGGLEIRKFEQVGDCEANGHLFAASKDMFDVLEEILNYKGGADSPLQDEYVVGRAMAALEKAKGAPNDKQD